MAQVQTRPLATPRPDRSRRALRLAGLSAIVCASLTVWAGPSSSNVEAAGPNAIFVAGVDGDDLIGPTSFTVADPVLAGDDNMVFVRADDGVHDVLVVLGAPRGEKLEVGRVYTSVQRAPFQNRIRPGLNILVDGRWCDWVNGSFVIDELQLAATKPVVLAAHWRFGCGDDMPGAGWARVNASVPVAARSIGPRSLSFDPQTVGTSSLPLVVTIRNDGSDPLRVPAPGLEYAGTELAGRPFEIDTATRPDPCTDVLPVGQTCSVSVRYQPAALGRHSAWLTFGGYPPVDQLEPVLLTGSATAGADRLFIEPGGSASNPHLTFTNLTVDGNRTSVSIRGQSTSYLDAEMRLDAPPGEELHVGTFDSLGDFAPAGLPALRVQPSSCDTSVSLIVIDQISFAADGTLTSLVARWETKCFPDAPVAEFGGVRFNSSAAFHEASVWPAWCILHERRPSISHRYTADHHRQPGP